MEEKRKNELQWLVSPLLAAFQKLGHASFKRHGGASQGPFTSLNLSYTVGDDPKAVETNFLRVQEALGLDKIATMEQCHGVTVAHVTKTTWQKAPQADVLMTQEPKIGLMVRHADCQAAIFYDPRQQALAVVHAGWRGNVQNVYAHTVQAMEQAFQTRPEDLCVAIFPSLGPQAAQFIHYQEELPEAFWKYRQEGDYFDLWAVAQEQLLALGIPLKQIDIARICTYSSAEDFFSYRRAQVTGRQGTVAFLQG